MYVKFGAGEIFFPNRSWHHFEIFLKKTKINQLVLEPRVAEFNFQIWLPIVFKSRENVCNMLRQHL